MAYGGKRNYKTKSKAVANLPSGPSTNKAVKRVYAKSKYVPKSKTAVNKKAIMTLSRQVKNLQNQRYGEIQTAIDNYAGEAIPNQDTPLCFAINDFYNGTPVYMGTLVAGVPGFNLAGTFNRNTYQSDMMDAYEWNARMNTEHVSHIEYKPVSTRLDFEMIFNDMGSLDQGAQVRVTLFKVKPIRYAGAVDCTLPERLGAYRNLSTHYTDPKANNFSPRLHEVLYDKRLKILNDSTRPIRTIQFSIPYTFKTGHVIRPDITSQPAGQVFVQTVPQNDIIWCMVSCNNEAHVKFDVAGLKIRRMLKWRDRDGIQG